MPPRNGKIGFTIGGDPSLDLEVAAILAAMKTESSSQLKTLNPAPTPPLPAPAPVLPAEIQSPSPSKTSTAPPAPAPVRPAPVSIFASLPKVTGPVIFALPTSREDQSPRQSSTITNPTSAPTTETPGPPLTLGGYEVTKAVDPPTPRNTSPSVEQIRSMWSFGGDWSFSGAEAWKQVPNWTLCGGDAHWDYMSRCLMWQIILWQRGADGMVWETEEEYFAGDFIMDPRD
jgi:hypothetical protein